MCLTCPCLARTQVPPASAGKQSCRMEKSHPSAFAVNLFRRHKLRLGSFESRTPVFARSEKAGFVTLVTGRAHLFDLNQERISIAIKGDLLNRLRMSATLPFHPKLLPRPAPEMRFATLDS